MAEVWPSYRRSSRSWFWHHSYSNCEFGTWQKRKFFTMTWVSVRKVRFIENEFGLAQNFKQLGREALCKGCGANNLEISNLIYKIRWGCVSSTRNFAHTLTWFITGKKSTNLGRKLCPGARLSERHKDFANSERTFLQAVSAACSIGKPPLTISTWKCKMKLAFLNRLRKIVKEISMFRQTYLETEDCEEYI